MQQDIPDRPDLNTGDSSIEEPAVTGRSRRSRIRLLAVIVTLVVVAAGLSVTLARDGGSDCDGSGPAVDGAEIGVRWVVGHRYCFRMTSSVSGVVDAGGVRSHHVADAEERIELLIRSVSPQGTVGATMRVVDESATIDGTAGSLRAPLEIPVTFEPSGVVRSQYGWGVPTGTSQGNSGLPSLGQFLPLLPPRTVAPGEHWTESLSFPLSADTNVTGTLDGTFVGPSSADGRDGLLLETTFSIDVFEQEIAATGLPAGASMVVRSGPTTLEQDFLVDPDSHELLHATITSRGPYELTVVGRPAGDLGAVPSGFDGTLSLTIERID